MTDPPTRRISHLVCEPVEDVLGAILAGGRGTRLGRPKATALLGGRPLLEYPLIALEAAGLETVVIAKRDTVLPPVAAPPGSSPTSRSIRSSGS